MKLQLSQRRLCSTHQVGMSDYAIMHACMQMLLTGFAHTAIFDICMHVCTCYRKLSWAKELRITMQAAHNTLPHSVCQHLLPRVCSTNMSLHNLTI